MDRFCRFADIVGSSSVLLGKFKLKLNANVWKSSKNILEVASLERKIQTIEITDVDGNHDALVKIFKRLGPTLRHLFISYSTIDDFTLRETLRSSESLETLVFTEVSIVKKLPAINSVSMRKLKSLAIYHCNWNITNFIKAQVTSFEVKSYHDEGLKCSIFAFLANQIKLKELKFRGTSARLIFQKDELVTNCNYGLESFLVEHLIGSHSDNVNWHLTAFLSLHVETLKRVEVTGPHYEHLNGFVIANLEKLDSLSIDVRGLPKNGEFYDQMENQPNKHLKELSLRGFFVQIESIKKILKKYRFVEKLELNDWGNGTVTSELLIFVATNCPNVKTLLITEMTKNEDVKMPILEKLTVSYFRDSFKLVQFITNNTSITEVKIGIVYQGQITTTFIEDLKHIQHVKHLSFSGSRRNSLNESERQTSEEKPETFSRFKRRNVDFI